MLVQLLKADYYRSGSERRDGKSCQTLIANFDVHGSMEHHCIGLRDLLLSVLCRSIYITGLITQTSVGRDWRLTEVSE